MTTSSLSRCPICGKAAVPATRPFCSERCAQVDLGRWLNESYRVPSAEVEEADIEEIARGTGHEAG